MTDDYKELLLKYLTGNITKETQSNTLNYEELNTVDYEDIGFGSPYSISDYVQCKDSNGNPNGKTLVYGTDNSVMGGIGFIAIFEGTKLLYITEQYNTGTYFGKFKRLEVDETGQVYGIDYYNEKYRFILLNNISELSKTGQRQVILRQSYYLQGSVQIDEPYYTFYYVKKSPQSANYMIIGANANNTDNGLTATLLKINVGAANEWIDYTVSVSIPSGVYFAPLNAYIYFNKDDNPQIEFYCINYESSKYKLNVIKNVGENVSRKAEVLSDIVGTFFTGGNLGGANQLVPYGLGSFYMLFNGSIPSSSDTIQKSCVIDYKNDTYTIIYQKTTSAASSWSAYPSGRIFIVNNLPTLYLSFPKTGDSNVTEQYVGIIPQLIKQLPDSLSGSYTSVVLFNAIYNMFNFSVIYKDTSDQLKMSNWKIVYNPNNYNNEPYENTNSLIANNGMVFDSNNSLIFARNLYNYKVYNNRAISILNVPNTSLNDTPIAKVNILGETNKDLLSNTQDIDKNIYEDLYINFFTTLNMENRNTDNYIKNLPGAIRLNQSVSKLADYDVSKCTKVKINYDDGSSRIGGIECNITDGVGTYEILVYNPTDKNVISIDFISEDESTIYNTISNINMTSDKIYKISQKVHIE